MTALSPTDLSIALAIAGAALVTYSLRLGGLLLAEHLPKNGGFKSFMEALPGTILLSLVAPGIFTDYASMVEHNPIPHESKGRKSIISDRPHIYFYVGRGNVPA